MCGQSIRLLAILAAVAGGAVAVGGCGGATSPNYDPQIPTEWAAAVTNPFFPLVVGTKYAYNQTIGGNEIDTVEVLPDTRVIQGVTATVVHDRVYTGGELTEDTYDWYAQDAAGNVWYLGEDTKELEGGQVVSTAGSFEWGVNGALPGIIMWADPVAHLGEPYRQEFARGVAEDWGKVVAGDQSVTVEYGSFTGCLKTDDWNALDSGPHEHKFYCAQTGVVLGVGGNGDRVELATVTGP